MLHGRLAGPRGRKRPPPAPVTGREARCAGPGRGHVPSLGRNFEAMDPPGVAAAPREVLRVAEHGDGWGVPAEWE